MLRSLPIGLAAAALLLGVLGLARLLNVQVDVPDLIVREVEVITMDPPPPPPPEEPPPDAPPPPPALMEVSQVPDPSRVPIPKAEVPMDITLPVATFYADLPPAPLPETPVAKPQPSPRPAPRPAAKPTPTPRPAPPPVVKSHYNVGELDGNPRLLRHGSAAFPSALARKGVSQGTVVLEVELGTGGSVSVRRVVSASHPELVGAARRVAASARFTPPTRRGQPVRAIMRWPITIKK